MQLLHFFRRTRYEPIEHITFDGPLLFGASPADFTRATINVIKKNAGKMPAIDLADAMGWRLKRLARVAKAERIDLRYPPAPPEKEQEPRGA